MAQRIKDPALSLLLHKFDLWPWARQKKKKNVKVQGKKKIIANILIPTCSGSATGLGRVMLVLGYRLMIQRCCGLSRDCG